MRHLSSLILLSIGLFHYAIGSLVTQVGQQIVSITDTSGTKTQTVTFPQAFPTAPSVGVALLGLEQTSPNPLDYHLGVSLITTTGFTITVTYGTSTTLTSVPFSYIATISAQSGVYISTISIYSTDSDVSGSYNTPGERSYYRPIPQPAGMTNPIEIPYLKGFTSTGSTSPRIALGGAGVGKLHCFIWGDTAFLQADVTIITYSGDDFAMQYTTYSLPADQQTNSAGGSKTTSTYDVSFSAYTKTPIMFYGMRLYDFRITQGYSMRETVTTGASSYTINFIADQKTSIYQASIFTILMCPDSAKDCLCAPGFYASATGTCTACNSKCATCTGASVCQTCKTGYGLVSSMCVTCPTGTYTTSTACPNCDAKCATCTDATTCQTCKANYGLVGSSCVTCSAGKYPTPTSCTNCDAKCTTCTDASTCQSCNTGYGLVGSSCTTCPAGKYPTSTSCASCDAKCATCTDASTCQTCKTSYGLVGSSCVTCPAGKYPTSTSCTDCPINCATCTDGSTCQTCKTGFGLVSSSCVTCPAGKYPTSTSCATCPTKCATCTDTSTCQSCNSGYGLVSNTCVTCADGTYLASGKCPQCPSGCATCTSSSSCQTCKADYLLTNNECVACPIGTYLNGGSCKDCSEHCATCSDATTCIACKSGFMVSNNQCVSEPVKASTQPLTIAVVVVGTVCATGFCVFLMVKFILTRRLKNSRRVTAADAETVKPAVKIA